MSELKQLSIKLPAPVFAALEAESKKREGLMPAPTRTARQLITERLEELNERT